MAPVPPALSPPGEPTVLARLQVIARAASGLSGWICARPTICFIALSLLFGPLTILLTPPFRGPDEPAHLMRAYGVATGELIRSSVNEQGRSGVFLPPRLDHEM